MIRNSDVSIRLRRAVFLHRSGEVLAAMCIYSNILKEDPENAEVLHLSGVATLQLGNAENAVRRIKKAVALDSSYPVYHNSLANAFIETNNAGDAERHYRCALKLDPYYMEAHFGLGNAFFRSKKWGKAIKQYENAVRLAPESDKTHYNLGLAYFENQQTDCAIRSFQNAIRINPYYTEAHINLGHVLFRNHSYNDAMIHYKKAVHLAPGSKQVHVSMAKVYRKLNEFDKAIACIHRILKFEPGSVGAWNELGALYLDQNRHLEAKRCFEKAIGLNPDDAIVHKNLGMLHWSLNNLDKAITFYRKAVFIDPEYAEAYYSLGNAYGREKKISNSILCYRKAIELKKNEIKYHSYLVRQLQHGCFWEELKVAVDRLLNLAEPVVNEDSNPGFPPFLALSVSSDPQFNQVVSKSWCRHYFSKIQPLQSQTFEQCANIVSNREDSHIHIGYLSCDFNNHATAHLMRSLFKTHDRSRFQISVYSHGADDKSDYRRDIIAGCDRFVDLRFLNNEDAARNIAADRIDILVDLKGHTNGNRMEILAYRPAPIQVAYLGFPGTCGADFIDYILGDDTVTPLEQQEFYSEKIVLLPYCYQVNDADQKISTERIDRSSIGLFENSFVFCSFNEPYKIEQETFNVWMDLLHMVPNSYLWLLETSPVQVKNLRLEAKERGIKENRLVFSSKVEKSNHLLRLKLADLCLDTWTVNGHTTTSDALWAGVPVVTMIGNHFASKVSASLLKNLGLSELITYNRVEYQQLAIKIALNPIYLKSLRKTIRQNKFIKPLFNTKQFVKYLEKAYLKMWSNFLERKTVDHIIVKR